MTHRRLSPELFCALQWLSLAGPLAILLAVVAAIAFWMRGNGSLYLSLLTAAFYIVATGGIALMYLAWWMSMTFRGIVAIPKKAWEICAVADFVTIKSMRFEVTFPISRPKEYVEVWDGGFDGLKGLEDKGLVIDFGHLFRIVVPGSSINFETALAHIQTIRPVRIREIE